MAQWPAQQVQFIVETGGDGQNVSDQWKGKVHQPTLRMARRLDTARADDRSAELMNSSDKPFGKAYGGPRPSGRVNFS